ncbi:MULTISPECIES: hypothetical protein [unclassified Leptolyngbya]|uniref:hypothetical protein n=1 Tax=unclassified Leptolyngbya TaxID=2650499 RepID=UPI0016867A17|nr:MULTISPECIES: hypothetical protein [unclassified Leptolyngbya]MBD1910220.1 hypothetical protein [Leptolyngbya sp. FACHB-8]MBD2156404.1 hypothetical protein [Leptolyngbya sp. FACHB-16]
MDSATLSFNSQSNASGGFIPQANCWVQLRDRLTPFSHDEALLLCEEEGDRWVAWIPDHGEVVLHRSQFVAE